MQDTFTVSLDRREYRWMHDDDIQDVGRAWEWVDNRYEVVESPDSRIQRLNELFGEHCLEEFVASCESREELARAVQVVGAMGLARELMILVAQNRFEGLPYASLLHECKPEIEEFPLHQQIAKTAVAGSNPFNDSVLRDWLTSGDVTMPEWLTSGPIMVTGCKPFSALDFVAFLKRHGLDPCEGASDDVGVIIIGREDWSRDFVDGQIELRTGKNLHVLSQELLVAMIANGQDPFDGDSHLGVLDRFRTTHPGLEYVSEGWPGWVKIWVQPRSGKSGKRTFTEWAHNESLLKACGYEVGKTSTLTREQRHGILDFAFQRASIPPHCADWGAAGSGPRLQAMAYHIAWLVGKYAAETRKDMSVAVADWTSDLAWLKDRFYRGHMKFRWPDPRVG